MHYDKDGGFVSLDKTNWHFYSLGISDSFDGMLPVSDYLRNTDYSEESVYFIATCLEIFASNGWEEDCIRSFKMIGFPVSVDDAGSVETFKALVLKQSNNGSTFMLSELPLPDYYTKFEVERPKIPAPYNCWKWRSYLSALLPVKGKQSHTD